MKASFERQLPLLQAAEKAGPTRWRLAKRVRRRARSRPLGQADEKNAATEAQLAAFTVDDQYEVNL